MNIVIYWPTKVGVRMRPEIKMQTRSEYFARICALLRCARVCVMCEALTATGLAGLVECHEPRQPQSLPPVRSTKTTGRLCVCECACVCPFIGPVMVSLWFTEHIDDGNHKFKTIA